MKEKRAPCERLTLVEPTLELESSFRQIAEEHQAEGNYGFQKELADFASYIRRLRATALGEGLKPGQAPSTTFWLVRDGKDIVARASLQHELTPETEKEGGHIGYNVRPSERRKVYGTRILAMVLDKARERGMCRVLVTCDTDNIASGKIIRANGGKFENEVISDDTSKAKSRYWIDL